MPKRKVQGEAPPKDSRGIKKRKPVTPKITVSSDPSIPSDYNRIEKLLEQKKSWRSSSSRHALTHREIANYFGNYTAESIKKRFHLCKKVLMETFSPEEVYYNQNLLLMSRTKN